MQPRLALQFTDTDDELTKRVEPVARRRVLSEDAARAVTEMMKAVVEGDGGTGSRARLPGWYAAGKTGTAEKVINGRLVEGRYISSFAGFAPVDDPRVAILVMADEPQGIYYGSWVAAPTFAAVARDVLHYLEVPYDYDPSEYKPPVPWWQQPLKPWEPAMVEVPNIKNLSVKEAQATLRSAGLRPLVQGLGERVFDQFPPSGVEVEEGTSILVYSSPQDGKAPGSATEVMVPDLQGMTMREVANILAALELRLEPVGSGTAVDQDPCPGTSVAPGTTIRVHFQRPSEN
jgi:stage V sporulation protein D (sporulation-specific penicillin-binding protein)